MPPSIANPNPDRARRAAAPTAAPEPARQQLQIVVALRMSMKGMERNAAS